MTYNIRFLSKGKNYSGCWSLKGYRKDLKKCITAANNTIYRELKDRKDIYEVRVNVCSYGRKVYNWKYIPTRR